MLLEHADDVAVRHGARLSPREVVLKNACMGDVGGCSRQTQIPTLPAKQTVTNAWAQTVTIAWAQTVQHELRL